MNAESGGKTLILLEIPAVNVMFFPSPLNWSFGPSTFDIAFFRFWESSHSKIIWFLPKTCDFFPFSKSRRRAIYNFRSIRSVSFMMQIVADRFFLRNNFVSKVRGPRMGGLDQYYEASVPLSADPAGRWWSMFCTILWYQNTCIFRPTTGYFSFFDKKNTQACNILCGAHFLPPCKHQRGVFFCLFFSFVWGPWGGEVSQIIIYLYYYLIYLKVWTSMMFCLMYVSDTSR